MAVTVKIDLDIKPVSILIEKVTSTIGVLYEPTKIVRKAKAEAEASLIITKAEAKVEGIRQRTVARLEIEENRRQQNMEDVLVKAIPQLNENSKPEDIDDDWLTNFFEKSRLTSNEEMQSTWAKILAGEANNPGSYSKKTVSVVSELGMDDAFSFNSLANFVWTIEDQLVPIVLDIKNKIYKDNDISFEKLTNLDALGLIRFDPIGSVNLSIQIAGESISVNYSGKNYILNPAEGVTATLDIGHVMLTNSGKELINVCSVKKIDGYEEYVLEQIRNKGLTVK